MRPYRGNLGLVERLSENAPLPSMNRIAQDRRDALAEIERLRAERDEARRLHGKLVLDGSAQINRLQAALADAIQFYDRLDREHAEGEAAMLDRMAAALLGAGRVDQQLQKVTSETK